MKFNDAILASASPRRRELLSMIFEDFRVVPSCIEENIPEDVSVKDACEYLALEKARDIYKSFPESLIIAADTGVVYGDEMLGKPSDSKDAYEMLRMLSGKTHYVYTGCALVSGEKQISFTVETEVTFYELSDNEILEYIASKDPFDKAGGYGIQTKGGLFVREIKGDYYNVVGLPIARLRREICEILK